MAKKKVKRNTKKANGNNRPQRKETVQEKLFGLTPAEQRKATEMTRNMWLSIVDVESLEYRRKEWEGVPQMNPKDAEYVYLVAEVIYAESGGKERTYPSPESLIVMKAEHQEAIKSRMNVIKENINESSFGSSIKPSWAEEVKAELGNVKKTGNATQDDIPMRYCTATVKKTKPMGGLIVDIYDKTPSLFENIRTQKELVEKHRGRCRLNIQTDDFEKIVKVLIKAKQSEDVAAAVIDAILSVHTVINNEELVYDCFWEIPRLFYAYQYVDELRRIFPALMPPTAEEFKEKYADCLSSEDSEANFYNVMAKDGLDRCAQDFRNCLENTSTKQLQDKSVTKAATASFSSDSEFYKGVLKAMERFAEKPWAFAECLAQTCFSMGDYLGENAVEAASELCKASVCMTEESIEEDGKGNTFTSVTDVWEDNPADVEEGFSGKDGEWFTAAGTDEEFVTLNMTPLAAITVHLAVWVMQFMQLSGEINISDLLRNNPIRKKDVKHLVNSVFLSYQRIHKEDEPDWVDEKMEFVGRLVAAYMMRVLIMDRTHNVEMFYQLAEGKLEESIKDNSTVELEMLRESNQELLKETDNLRKQIEDIQDNTEAKALKEEIKRLRDEIASLNQDVKDYAEEMATISIERNGLEEMFNDCSAQLEAAHEKLSQYPDEEEYSEEMFREIIRNNKVLLWGARADMLNEYRARFPEIDVCESTVIPAARMERYDYLICRVDFCSHGDFWATRETASRLDVPYRILTKGMTNDRHLKKGVCEMDAARKSEFVNLKLYP